MLTLLLIIQIRLSLEVEDVAAIRSYARPLYYKWTNSILRGNKENLNAVSEHPYVKGFYSGEKEIIEGGRLIFLR